jgi:transmembrane sensor
MKDAKELLEKYKAGACSPEELMMLDKWFHHLGEDERSSLSEDDLSDAHRILQRNMITLTRKSRIRRILPRAAAAAAALVLLVSVVLLMRKPHATATRSASSLALTEFGDDVAPGGTHAILTLEDGSKIDLGTAKNGELASQAGLSVRKSEGQLVYQKAGGLSPQSSADPFPEMSQSSFLSATYNLIETPRGGEYSVILSDGTRVWLNAASSLRYPAVFTGGERRVELSGEAYFEVAPNKSMPFRVQGKQQLVEVLGTHFNIASYADDEAVRTTLVEGKVKVLAGDKHIPHVLRPGQQSVVSQATENVMVKSVDVEEAIAWKKGYFMFNDENIQSIMRKVARWYNVDVEYKGKIPEVGFGGTVLKSKNISGVLKTLELTKAVHFKVQGRRVIVMP